MKKPQFRLAACAGALLIAGAACAAETRPGYADPDNWPQYHRSYNAWRFFAVLDEDEVVFVARNGIGRVQSLGFVLGARIAANLASAGVVLLACKPPEEVDRWLAGRKFVPYTPHSYTREEDVRVVIDKARTSGYCILEQQLEQDRRGIAVPIRTRAGDVVGAISVSLPIGNETTQQALTRALPVMREAEHALLALL